ncbi:MAG: 1-deoxy-D-xylulose-5-phosphate reductoisomerase [Alphaproteobacteria bacterium]
MALRPSKDSPRSVTILGSTGSVGGNTIDLVEREPDRFRVEALTGNRNVELLADQARRLRPSFVAVADPGSYRALRAALSGSAVELAAGPEALVEAGRRPAEFVMAAIVGAAGLEPTLAALMRGAVVGFANKETLVSAGDLVMAEARRAGARLIPVDSEHSAIYQVFDFDQSERVSRILLTASGGPFRTLERQQMSAMSPAQAVKHPNWTMGAKISVDSATMMNKGLEVIEAHHIFPVPADRIEIVVHPESVIHSMVEYVDGSVLAQLGTPDMRMPISYALGWPERMATPAARLDFAALGRLTFEAPNLDRFPALRVAREALRSGGSAPAVLNAANEVAVNGFLERRIGFLDIVRVVEETLEALPITNVATLEQVHEVDAEARTHAGGLIGASGRRIYG